MVSSSKGNKSDNFNDAILYGWVITSGKYEKLRKAGFTGFDEIESVVTDHEQMMKGLPRAGFSKENIFE